MGGAETSGGGATPQRRWEQLGVGEWVLKPGFEPAQPSPTRWQRLKAWWYTW